MVDFWVQFAVSVLKILLTQLHVDTTKQALYRTVLIDLANAIYVIFGATPPVVPPVPVIPPSS